MLNAMALDHATYAVITNGLEADPLAAQVRIDAVPKRHVGAVIFADDTLRRIVQKLGGAPAAVPRGTRDRSQNPHSRERREPSKTDSAAQSRSLVREGQDEDWQ